VLQLQEANLQVARPRETLARLDRFLAESERLDSAALSAGRTGAELHFAGVLREKLQQFRLELQSEMSRLELARQQALGAYHRAYREREILESLRARERHDYEQEQLRREQQELDAAHLLQRWRHRS
jgi:flagellar biosynthesis chaperone FliJ